MAKRTEVRVGTTFEGCFDFVAIDEIQRNVEGENLFSLPGSKSKRPFFSPLVYHSKMIGKFSCFIVSGTGINFEAIKELMGSSTMKSTIVTSHQVISDLRPLTKDDVVRYSELILKDHNISKSSIDNLKFVSKVSS